MGPVMRTAGMKPDVALLDNDDMQGVEGDEDWQFVSLGEQKNFGIRTAGKFRTSSILFSNSHTDVSFLDNSVHYC